MNMILWFYSEIWKNQVPCHSTAGEHRDLCLGSQTLPQVHGIQGESFQSSRSNTPSPNSFNLKLFTNWIWIRWFGSLLLYKHLITSHTWFCQIFVCSLKYYITCHWRNFQVLNFENITRNIAYFSFTWNLIYCIQGDIYPIVFASSTIWWI